MFKSTNKKSWHFRCQLFLIVFDHFLFIQHMIAFSLKYITSIFKFSTKSSRSVRVFLLLLPFVAIARRIQTFPQVWLHKRGHIVVFDKVLPYLTKKLWQNSLSKNTWWPSNPQCYQIPKLALSNLHPKSKESRK